MFLGVASSFVLQGLLRSQGAGEEVPIMGESAAHWVKTDQSSFSF